MIWSQEYGKRPNMVEFEAYEQNGGTWGAAYLWSLGMGGGATPRFGDHPTKRQAIIASAKAFIERFGGKEEFSELCGYANDCVSQNDQNDQLDLFVGVQ